jgi:hypothetical protein
MTSQMEADALLAEHRAVMAALMKNCISQPTEAEYEAQLNLVSEEIGRCVIFISDLPPALSAAL